MKIRNIMSGILAGVMTVSMGTMGASAEGVKSVTTVSTTQSTPSFVKQKTLVKGGEADYTLKAATPGKSKFDYSKTGIVKVTCDTKGEIHVVAKKTGTTVVRVTNSKGKRIGAFKFTVVAKKSNALDDLIAMGGIDATSAAFDFSFDMKGTENEALKLSGTVAAKEYEDKTIGVDVSMAVDVEDINWACKMFSIYIADDGMVYFDVETTKKALQSLSGVSGVDDEDIAEAIEALDQFNTRYIALSIPEVLQIASGSIVELYPDSSVPPEMMELGETLDNIATEINENGISSLNKTLDSELSAVLNEDADMQALIKSAGDLLTSFRNRVQLTGSGMLTNKDTYKALTISNKNFTTFGKTWNAWLTYDAKTPVNKIMALAGAEPVDLSVLKMDYKAIKSMLDETGTFKITLKTNDVKNIGGKQATLTVTAAPTDAEEVDFTSMTAKVGLKLGTKSNGAAPDFYGYYDLTTNPEYRDTIKLIIVEGLREYMPADVTPVPYEPVDYIM